MRHHNVHNYEVESPEPFLQVVENDLRWAEADPLKRLVILSGDFNFAPKNKAPFYLKRPNNTRATARQTASADTYGGKWTATTAKMIEMMARTPTHFIPEPTMETFIDRTFLSKLGDRQVGNKGRALPYSRNDF